MDTFLGIIFSISKLTHGKPLCGTTLLIPRILLLSRILDSDDDDDEIGDEVKTQPQQPSSTVINPPAASVADSKKDALKSQLTFPDLVKAQKGDLFFIQLPDHLPGRVPRRPKSETGALTTSSFFLLLYSKGSDTFC